MKRSFEKAKKAVERLFWDTCFVETFSEETAAWGESLHEKGEGETFPCRLTEKAEVCGTDGLLTQTEKTVILLYPAEKEIAAGSAVRILRENGLCAGMSGPFALAASARGCFPKARIALETGKAVDPGRALYDMGTYSEAALLRAARTALEAQGFRASDFGDAAIEALARLDERENAQYIRSLRAYLSDGLNLRRAAERLGVHRNTLAYRMRRIEARFALDLSDMNTCFELLFSLWLKEGLGGRPVFCPCFKNCGMRRAVGHTERCETKRMKDFCANGTKLKNLLQ